MNARRGFRRLSIVLAIGYYSIGGILMYLDWDDARSTQRRELSQCLDAAAGKKYIHLDGTPYQPDPAPSPSAIKTAEASCRQYHPPVVNTWWDNAALILFITFPVMLYGLWRVLAWIGSGFIEPKPG